MNDISPLLIRADAGGQLGTGHVMRMIALAQAWQDRGGRAVIAACQCPPALTERLKSENIEFVPLGNHPLGSKAELTETIQLGRDLKSPWIVIDGYHFNEDYQKALKQNGFKVLAVDDYGHCKVWHADLILNQNVYAAELSYPSMGSAVEVLRGPEFALLRNEFIGKGSGEPAIRIRLNRLLLSFGGVDPDNVTAKVISALNTLQARGLSLRVLVGAGNPNRESLELLAAASPHRIEFLCDVPDMPAQYEWANGIIGAGGTTCLEWLLFSLPAALVRVADNQNLVVSTLAESHRCLDLGWHQDLVRDHLACQLSTWLESGASDTNYNAFQVDVWGSSRVAARLDNRLRLRRANAADCKMYFHWANDPLVRQNALNTDRILWEDHCKWFYSRLESPDVRFFLCIDEANEPVGQVRFEKKSPPDWEIDFSVDPLRRGKRIGFKMMSLALRTFRNLEREPVLAVVKRSNPASQRVFERLGFTMDSGIGGELIYLRA